MSGLERWFTRAPRGVLMDLDGTLYRTRPMRRRMALALGLSPLTSLAPRRSIASIKAIACFRRVREELRELGCPEESLEELQYAKPAGRLGIESADLRATVEEWMHVRPLRYLKPCIWPDLTDFLAQCTSRGTALGVFSDFPVESKLEALGIADSFSLKLCATDPDVNAFKPHPRGFQRACERWDFAPTDVLYVGDRPDVDAEGARAAGMPCAILGADETAGDYFRAESYAELGRALARLGD